MSIAKIASSSAENYYYEKDPLMNENGEGNNLQFHGKQAEMLGIEEGASVSKEEFSNLLEGKSLDGETQLLDRSKNITSGNENAVFDLSLSAPKSVSLVALGEGGDERLIEAHEKAVATVIQSLEDNYSKARGYVEQEDGSKARESYDTDNMLIATALHSTARPTENDPEPNAHLHTHVLTFNQTYDEKTDSYKALDSREMFADQKALNDTYLSELAKNVKEIGYDIEDNGKGSFNLTGVSQEAIDKFSSRRDEVNEKMEEQGLTSSKDRAFIGSHFKSDKVDMNAEDIKDSWDRKAAEIGTSISEMKENSLSKGEQEKHFSSAKEVLETAGSHLSSNNATFTEKELLNASSKLSLGEFSRNDLKQELDSVKKIGQKEPENLKRLGEDSKGKAIFTTKDMHDIEKRNHEILNQGTKIEGVMSKDQAEAGLKDFEDKNFKLTDGQKNAANEILSGTGQISAIQGDAGTGKSTMLEAVAHAIKYNESNTEVLVSALANKAVSGAVEASKMESGEKFDGVTLHKLTRGGLEEKLGNNQGQVDRVKGIAVGMEDINLSSGKRAFSSDKGFSIDPSNSFSVKGLGKEASFKTKRSELGGKEVYEKSTKVNAGEHKGAVKKDKTTVSVGGAAIKHETTVKLKNGEKFASRTETFNPVKLGGRSGSPLAKMGAGLVGSSKKEVANAKGKTTESSKSFAGLTLETKKANTVNADQSKVKVKALGGLASAERNIISTKNDRGSKNITTKKVGVMGFSFKSVNETTHDKNGNMTSKVSSTEKSFMGMTFGKTTTLDKEGNSNTFSYTKVAGKTSEPKLIESKKVDPESMKKEMKTMDKTTDMKSNTKLLIVDESSMVGAKDLNKILESIKSEKSKGNEIKVVFMGDSKQLQSIGAGKAFDDIQKAIGDKTVVMNESQRQRNDTQKGITDPAAAKEIKVSLDNLDKAGGLHEIKDSEERTKAAVAAIVKKEEVATVNFKGETETTKMDYKNTVGLAATNAENKAINEGVRTELKSQGLIKDEVKTTVNVGVLKDSIKQSSAANYDKGMKLSTFEEVKGMKKGTEYKVIDTDKSKNTLTLKSTEVNKKTGKHDFTTVKTKEIAGKITVKKEEERSFGAGDKIRITETDKKAGLTNSDTGLILEMDQKNKIAKVDFGEGGVKSVDLNKQKGIEHGYSMTNHSAQGISVDRVVASMDTKNNSMNSMNSYYVAMSRQKASSTIITDDKDKLLKQVNKAAENKSSLDDLSKKVEVKSEPKIEAKVSDSLKKEIEAVKGSEREEGRHIKPSEGYDSSNKAGAERNEAKAAGNEEGFKSKQTEFMNQQVVARNGYSESRVEDFANKEVDKGTMTKGSADQFVSNSNDNAKALSDAGILESKGNGDYKFTDSKAKEILHDNADKSHEEIAKVNVEAYNSIEKSESKEVEVAQKTERDHNNGIEKSENNSQETDKNQKIEREVNNSGEKEKSQSDQEQEQAKSR